MMIVNKTKIAALALAGLLSLPAFSAQASNIVPSLYNVEDFVVDFALFGNEKSSNSCGIFKRDLTDQTLKRLQKENLPARASMGRNVKDQSKVSVTLVPKVITIQPSSKQCTSWISLSAQTRNGINLPPADYHREVRLVYWDGGILVHTAEHSHGRSVKEAIDKLIDQLVVRYDADQPPKLKKK